MKQAIHRAEKGVIEIELDFKDQIITSLKITGDFFIHPEEAIETIENGLKGIKIEEKPLLDKLTKIYQDNSISTPGITINDWIKVIIKAFDS